MSYDEVPMDNINLTFTVEEWLNSETAEVTIDVDASLDVDGHALKQKVRDALKQINDSVTWRFSRVNRSRDRAGRETWRIGAQARIIDDELDNLSGRCRELSEPGLQFRVGNVCYSPKAETVENLNRELRSKINKLITAELSKLNTELKGRQWRVSSIQFGQDMSYSNMRAAAAAPQIMMASSGGYDENAPDMAVAESSVGSGGFEVSQKVTLAASVTISSTVSGFENG